MKRPAKRSATPPAVPTPEPESEELDAMLGGILEPFSWTGSDGRTLSLTVQQTRLVSVIAAGVKDWNEAARRCGYASAAAASGAFRKAHVREAFQKVALQELGAEIGSALSTLKHLHRNAKSEKVRLEAANSILDRAGIRTDTPTASPMRAGGVTISIDLSGKTDPASKAVTIEHDAPGVSESEEG